jgi:hypothetical protein
MQLPRVAHLVERSHERGRGMVVQIHPLGLEFRIGELLGRLEAPYLRRWVLKCRWGSLRLHQWLASDDLRNPHDHAWDFLTLVLRGSYTDISPNGEDELRPGDLRFRRAEHQHSVRVNRGGCWSLLVTGPERRVWGFWVQGKFRKRNKYFFEWGHH